MNIDFEEALSILKDDPTDLIAWSVILDAFGHKVSSTRTINGKTLASDIILSLASADFVNQGTTITVLHGNAAGNPSWGSVVTNDITNANVTLAKIQNIATSKILGRVTAGSGTIEQLTGTQLTVLLDVFATDATTKGLVPGSNSVGNTYFLRADGTWAIPNSTTHSSLSNLSYATAGHTGFEPALVAGTDAQYYRGDKTWQNITGLTGSLEHNDLSGLQGGSAVQRYHLTAAGNTIMIGNPIVNITADGAEVVPSGLAVSESDVIIGSDGSVTAYVILTWDAIVGSDILDHYQIRYKKDTDLIYTYLVTDINSLRIDGLSPGSTYDFGVASKTKYGVMSAFSGDIVYVVASSVTPPATATGLVATAGVEAVLLTWNANTETDLAGYTVYRNTVNNHGGEATVGTVSTTYFIDGGRTGDVPLYYWIKAINTSGLLSVDYSTFATATPRFVISTDIAASAVTAAKTSLAAIHPTTGNLNVNTVGTDQIVAGAVTSGKGDLAIRGWTQTCVFSSTSTNQVNWGAGSFVASDGTTYSISAGNTGAMGSRTYIYLDIATSTTAYQVTTTAGTAVGNGKVLVATAINHTTEAVFHVFGGVGGVYIDASDIVAESIVAGNIAANAIETGHLSAGSVTATKLSTSNFIKSAGSFTNNSPGAGQLAWTGCKVVYEGTEHTITNGNCAVGDKHIYWELGSPTVFSSSVSLPALTNNGFLVAFNDSGTAIVVWNSTVINGNRITAGSITATQISAHSITANEITAGTITSTEILAGTITGDRLAINTITSDKVLAISADKIWIDGSLYLSNWKHGGAISVAVLGSSGGSGYTPGAVVLTVVQGGASGGTLNATANGSGVITSIDSIATAGTKYTTATGVATSCGAGSGCTVNLTVVASTTIDGSVLETGTVVASAISTTTLSAIVADLGAVTAGSIVLSNGATDKIWLNDSGDGALNIGGLDKGTAPFRVTSTGLLSATGATISGAITATSGSFTGSIYSGVGTIGGFTIDTHYIYHGTKCETDGFSVDGITLCDDGSLHAPNFYINADGSSTFSSGVLLPHIIRKAASDNVRNFSNAEVSASDTAYLLRKTITLTNGLLGTIRIKFELKKTESGGGGNGYGKVCINGGGAFGTEQVAVVGAYVVKSEDKTHDFAPGDTIELWLYAQNTDVVVYAQNFSLCYIDDPIVEVAYTIS